MASVLDTTGPASETSSADFRQVATVPGGVVAVVAISTAAAALITFDLSARAFVAAFFCVVLVVIAAVDLERGIIPNRIVVPAGILVLLGDIAAQPHRGGSGRSQPSPPCSSRSSSRWVRAAGSAWVTSNSLFFSAPGWA